jgi:hypothetical protein
VAALVLTNLALLENLVEASVHVGCVCGWVIGCWVAGDSVGIGSWSTKNVDGQGCLLQIWNANLNLEYSGVGDVVWAELLDGAWFTSRQTCLAPLRRQGFKVDFHMHHSSRPVKP